MPATLTDNTKNPIIVDGGATAFPFGAISVNDPLVFTPAPNPEPEGASGTLDVSLTATFDPSGASQGSLADPTSEITGTFAADTFTQQTHNGQLEPPDLAPTAVLQDLVYTAPTLSPGQSEVIAATVAYNYIAGVTYPAGTITDPTPVVIDVVTAPAIGLSAGPEIVSNGGSLDPLTGLAVTDTNFANTASVTATLVLDPGAPTDADGILTSGGLTKTGPGTYTLAATSVATLNNDLRQVAFLPSAVSPGQVRTTTLGVTVTDIGANLSTTSEPLLIHTTDPLTPTISDTTAGPISLASGATSDPFTKVTVNNAVVVNALGPDGGNGTLTIALSSPSGGPLGTLSDTVAPASIEGSFVGNTFTAGTIVAPTVPPDLSPTGVLGNLVYTAPTLAPGQTETIDATVTYHYDAGYDYPAGTVTDPTPIAIVVQGPTPTTPTPTTPTPTTPTTATPTTAPAPTTTTITLGATGATTATVTPGEGAITIQGAGTADIVTVSGADRAQATVSGTASAFAVALSGTTINGGNVGQISFIDGTVEYDPTSTGAQIARLYQAALGRAPDPVGLATWVQQVNAGASLTTVAAGFLGSAEFTARFPNTTNPTAFVTQLYANVLNRAPDAAGLATWVNAITSGQQTQAQVLVGFSQSTENQANTAGLTTNGLYVPNEGAAEIARLYYATLDRAPDLAGLTGWTSQLQSGAITLQQAAAGFTNSAEFTSMYGALSNSAFVNLMYQNVLGRAPDPTGDANWVNALNTGAMTRAGVALGFSQSSENISNLAPVIENNGIKLA